MNKAVPLAEFRASSVCVILAFMTQQDWIDQIKARGWGNAFSTLLDVVEPLGPLGAQLLWVAQPAMSLFGLGNTLADIAQILETPGGVERLRKELNEE